MKISTQQRWISRLSRVMGDEGKSAKELAATIGISVFYMTRVLDRLHRHNLVYISEWRRSGVQKERAFRIGNEKDAVFEKKRSAPKWSKIKTKDGGVL